MLTIRVKNMEKRLVTPPSMDRRWLLPSLGLILVPAVYLGDVFGRRPAFITLLPGWFSSAFPHSLAVVLPPAHLLVLIRLLQGASATIINLQIMSFMQQLFLDRKRGRAFGLFGMAIGIAVAVAGVSLLTDWEILRDRRDYAVVVPRSLMRTMHFVFGTLVTTAYFAGWSGMFVVLTVYL